MNTRKVPAKRGKTASRAFMRVFMSPKERKDLQVLVEGPVADAKRVMAIVEVLRGASLEVTRDDVVTRKVDA